MWVLVLYKVHGLSCRHDFSMIVGHSESRRGVHPKILTMNPDLDQGLVTLGRIEHGRLARSRLRHGSRHDRTKASQAVALVSRPA